jgi:hypothetical protein
MIGIDEEALRARVRSSPTGLVKLDGLAGDHAGGNGGKVRSRTLVGPFVKVFPAPTMILE